tara:strand:+ start:1658 stop:1909 length:252 start_codon:yes stop_codon:yes gene_type:complete
MSNLQLIARIHVCESNGWDDLLTKVDSYTQSLVDIPSAGTQIRSALVGWGKEVDRRASMLPPTEEQIAVRNPVMCNRHFGADD